MSLIASLMVSPSESDEIKVATALCLTAPVLKIPGIYLPNCTALPPFSTQSRALLTLPILPTAPTPLKERPKPRILRATLPQTVLFMGSTSSLTCNHVGVKSLLKACPVRSISAVLPIPSTKSIPAPTTAVPASCSTLTSSSSSFSSVSGFSVCSSCLAFIC